MNASLSVPQDYRVTLSISVDDRTIMALGVIVLGAVLWAKVRSR